MSQALSHLLSRLRARAELRARRTRGSRGLTLVEIMIVVVILSLLGGVIGVQLFNQLDRAKRDVARTQIRTLTDALELYKLTVGHYPTTSEGLQVLVMPKGGEKPFLPSVPKDPWNNDFTYIFPGTHNAGGFDLMSNGPDGAAGGEDDIGNWDAPATP